MLTHRSSDWTSILPAKLSPCPPEWLSASPVHEKAASSFFLTFKVANKFNHSNLPTISKACLSPCCVPPLTMHSTRSHLSNCPVYCVTLLPHAIAVFRQHCQTQHCCPISLWHGRYTSHAPCQAGAACSMTIFTLAVASCRVLVHTSLFTHSLTASYPWGTHWVSQSEQDTRATSSGTHLLPHSVISPRLCI